MFRPNQRSEGLVAEFAKLLREAKVEATHQRQRHPGFEVLGESDVVLFEKMGTSGPESISTK